MSYFDDATNRPSRLCMMLATDASKIKGVS